MKCPYCQHVEDRVVDSRETCSRRFTSYERIEEIPYMVVKKDGKREAFDRNKVLTGLLTACEKRPVPVRKLEEIVDEAESQVQESAEREIPTQQLGELVMMRLRELDKVAFVRFASVYRQFEDVNEFLNELRGLIGTRSRKSSSR
jgi:transcriptional repressor NrdR